MASVVVYLKLVYVLDPDRLLDLPARRSPAPATCSRPCSRRIRPPGRARRAAAPAARVLPPGAPARHDVVDVRHVPAQDRALDRSSAVLATARGHLVLRAQLRVAGRARHCGLHTAAPAARPTDRRARDLVRRRLGDRRDPEPVGLSVHAAAGAARVARGVRGRPPAHPMEAIERAAGGTDRARWPPPRCSRCTRRNRPCTR